MNFQKKIAGDLKSSQIDWLVIVLFLPIMVITYFFHEFGHWLFGEALGNDMTLSINNSSPKSGYFQNEKDALWSAIGGPVFTIIQALIFLIITWISKSIISYSFVYAAVFSRFFALVFGYAELQDESRIAEMLQMNKYLIYAIVLSILFLLLWKSSKLIRMNLTGVCYFFILSTITNLIVIGIDRFL